MVIDYVLMFDYMFKLGNPLPTLGCIEEFDFMQWRQIVFLKHVCESSEDALLNQKQNNEF